MLLLKPSFEILTPLDSEHILSMIERAGRTCYKSEDRITEDSAARFCKSILMNQHLSVIEHVSATVRLICDRGYSHELCRHRLASFCLSGDTVVCAYKYKVGGSSKRWTLEELYSWRFDKKRKGRLKLIRLRSVDNNGRIVPNQICSGMKEVFEVSCLSGRKVKASKDHLFKTPDGWRRLEELSPGDRIIANGVQALENKEWLHRVYIEENNTLSEVAKLAGCCVTLVTRALRKHGINKPLSMRKNRKPGHGNPGMHSLEERKRISERMSGDRSPSWKGDSASPNAGRLRANKMYSPDKCWGCETSSGVERHHMDENPVNNSPDNVKFLCQKCHKAFHFGQGVLTVFSDEIVSIVSAGVEQTYDLEMKGEPHNFVANGLVVHNSQESTRYVNYAKKGIAFILPPWVDIAEGNYDSFDCAQIAVTREHPAATIMWLNAMLAAERHYNELLNQGWQPQQARSVLPNSLKTEIVVTANMREWRHIFQQRTAKAAHPQMRELMIPLLEEFQKAIPVLFDDIDA